MVEDSKNIDIKQLTPIEHVLQNPDMYFSDISIDVSQGVGYDVENDKLIKINGKICNILLKMFDEILMNSADNAVRSFNSRNKMSYIDVVIDYNKMSIQVTNDGLSIPIRKNEDGKYLPEIAFTSLFSSSNFNGNRTGAGKNGVGASITNVMSKVFEIDIVCDGKRYIQTIENNCKNINLPIIEQTDANDYVFVSFVPDMETIKIIANIDNCDSSVLFKNSVPFMCKRLLDVNMCLNKYGIEVTYNSNILPAMTLEDYARMFIGDVEFVKINKPGFYELLISQTSAKSITFINNISVTSGAHIKYIYDQIYAAVVNSKKINSKDKNDKMLPSIKSNTCIVMSCNLVNPMFDGQGKGKLKTAQNMNSSLEISDGDMKRILDNIDFNSIINYKYIDAANKSLKVPRNKKLIINKLSDANYAGTKQSMKCTLFLCEGDSAARLAKDGIAYCGHDYFGVYPLGGKPMNTINKAIDKVTKNVTISNLSQILGLPFRTEYQIKNRDLNISTLRYGKIVMLKDADTDGAHIMGLVINLLQELYPELLQIKGFFNEFITPMIKLTIPIKMFNKMKIDFDDKVAGTTIVTKTNVVYPFYNTNDYNNFIKEHPECENLTISYIKGLGGHNQKDTIEYFKNYISNVVNVYMDEDAEKMLKIAFDKTKANDRKKMIGYRTEESTLPRYINKPINCSDFIKNDWLDYSYDACVRAIPSVIDGLKPSQRKILYVMFNNNYKPAKSNTEENSENFKKVFQVCGEVAQKGYYHHGDQSLNETIIKMAQDFCGSNNVPLLAYSGSFGSRDMNGDDAGAPRYISTTIHEIARLIFPKDDDCLLKQKVEDNTLVEPVYYVPIVPMILVNGAKGIGTGYSTDIPMYNILDIINSVRHKINTKTTEFHPFYNHYKGCIELNEYQNGYNIYGVYEITGNILKVTEIPFDYSKQKFIENLTNLYKDGVVKDFREDKSKSINDFNFIITLGREFNNLDELEKVFMLKSSIKLTNLVCFNKDNKITHYGNIEFIFNEWYKVRAIYYGKRKNKKMNDYELELKKITDKAYFVNLVINDKIIIKNRLKADIVSDIEKYKFEKIDGSYDHLLKIPISSLTKENYEKLMNTYHKTYDDFMEYSKKTIIDLWMEELNTLENYVKNNDIIEFY